MKWGILSTGRIAHVFASAFAVVPEAELYAVASRGIDKAQAFADRFHIPAVYGSYEELLSDPLVDVVYIATPMNCHYDNIKLCLQYNKNVVCEKSITMRAEELEEVRALAREKNLFLMEAMWMKFHEAYKRAIDWVRSGQIGEVKAVFADLLKFIPYDDKDRIFNVGLGGGALLDLGVYCIAFANDFAGKPPRSVTARQVPAPNGSDLENHVLLDYDGCFASCSYGFSFYSPSSGVIIGSKGRVEFGEHIHKTDTVRLFDFNNELLETFSSPYDHNGYEDEIRMVETCLAQGLKECPRHTLQDSLNVMLAMDNARKCF